MNKNLSNISKWTAFYSSRLYQANKYFPICSIPKTSTNNIKYISQNYTSLSPNSNIKFPSSSLHDVFLQPYFPLNLQAFRLKSSKRKKKKDKNVESSADEDEDGYDEWMLEKGKNFKDLKVKVPSLRMDAILKAGLGLSRNKVEEAFYGHKIRINGEKVAKKSQMVFEGDELDVRHRSSPDSDEGMARVQLRRVAKFDEGSDRFPVLLRKYPNLPLSEDDR